MLMYCSSHDVNDDHDKFSKAGILIVEMNYVHRS
jgi:hypothetical protein